MKYLLSFLAVFALSSCGESETIWTQLFQDNFNPTFRSGVNSYTDTGSFTADSTGASCKGTNCGAEYEGANDALSGTKIEMTLWFMIHAKLQANDRVVVFDPNDGNVNCEHAVGVQNISGTDTLVIYENSTNLIGSTPISGNLASITGYNLEFYGEDGSLTVILKKVNSEIARATATAVNSSCTYGEAGFGASDADNGGLEIKMRHFTVYTGE